MNRRVYIINRVFWPAEDATAQLAHDLALGLARRGWNVNVITATPGPDYQNVPGLDGDVRIKIVRTGRDGRRHTSYLAKARAYLGFLRTAKREVLDRVSANDRVIVKTDPPLLGLWIGSALSGRGAKVFHWVQDIFPEVAIALRSFGPISPLLGMLKPFRDTRWKQSTAVVSLGDDMATLIRSRVKDSVALKTIPNWAPQGLRPLDPTAVRQSWGIQPAQFVVGYSGNLGRAHDLNPLLQLADRLHDLKQVRIVIVGHGPQQVSLQSTAKRLGLSNLSFHPAVPRDQLGASLAAVDLHIVTMRERCLGMVWPSKFYGIVRCGRPLLFFGPSSADIAHLVSHHRLGLATRSHAVEEAIVFIRKLVSEPATLLQLSQNVKDFANREVGANRSIDAWHQLLIGQSSNAR